MANEKVTNGTHYSFGFIPATKAFKLEIRIVSIIGEPMFKALVEIKGKKAGAANNKEKMMSAAASAIGMLSTKLDPDEVAEILTTVMEYVSCNNERINIDKHFTGKPAELWEVFIEALQVNYHDFFTGSLFSSLQSQLPK